jgi:hypothetical protein
MSVEQMRAQPGMDYGRVVREAWGITWRHRSLWLLGLFAGGVAAPQCAWSGGGGRPDSAGDPSRLTPGTQSGEVAAEVTQWITANIGLLATIAIALALVALAAFVVSLIAQGGLSRAGADAAEGRSPTLGATWAAGARLFWRFVGLWLTLVLGIIGLGVLAAGVAVLFRLSVGRGDAPWLGAVVLLLALPLIALGVALAVGFAIVVPFAQRAIALEDIGPIAGIRAGWRLARRNIGTSLLVWILSIGLAIAAGLGIVIGLAVVAIPLSLIGFALWSAAGWSTPTVAYVILAVLAVIALLLVLGAMLNTFFWHYWTLAYLRLSGREIGASTAAAQH